MRTPCCLVAALIATLCLAQGTGKQLPVGYDAPGSDQGGPSLAGGLGWIAQVWPRNITFAEEPAATVPTVMFITNFGGVDTVHELCRRFPFDAIHFFPPDGNLFPGREAFYQVLNSRERIDCFVISRFNMRSTPADVQYEILRRVRDGAGLVVIDDYDRSETFHPGFFQVKATESGSRLIPGIPYDGLRQWANQETRRYSTFNYWNTGGSLGFRPEAVPYAYGNVSAYPFGKGRMVWVDTGTHWARARRDGRTLLPHISQRRDMFVETDYYYSHTAKAILRACGQTPAVQITGVQPAGKVQAAPAISVSLAPGREAVFSGSLRWQARDTWGVVEASGRLDLSLEPAAETVALPEGCVRDAGRHFVDVWIEDAGGRTVDWGSGFVELDRGVPEPVITPSHPEGAPRGADLEGTVAVAGVPEGSAVRVLLVDRHWRVVGRQQGPLVEGRFAYRFSSEGLDGQVWTVQADALDAGGGVLARSWRTITSPHTRATRTGFHPLMTCCTMACPEESARREYLRRLGFLANRPYGPGDAMTAEAAAWNDIQMHPFPFNLRGAENDYKHDAINDWEDPQVKAEFTEAMRLVTQELKPFGHRGFNFTDDSAPAKEMPAGAYTTMQFHEWLREEYGGLDGVVQAWGLNKSSFHSLARVHREMIRKEYDAGNTAPWIDAQRFLQETWIRNMERGRDEARAINPDVAVGSDAGYYGEAAAELFGRLEYLAPYYRSNQVVKLAVSRGAMRRDGDYGACIGSYGEKPAEMSGRRAQIWEILFAGGTGLYYWMFPGTGMDEAMQLSDAHALYQCEVVEEIMSGIGDLMTGCRRVFATVAILDSQTSAICDQLEAREEPLTSVLNSTEAFEYALEDTGLNPHIITGPELAEGWLADNGTKLLCMAGANSLSEAELQAVREFVQGGGIVVADSLPGLRLPNGNKRPTAPLLDVFGVSFDAKGEKRRARGTLTGSAGEEALDFGPAVVDPRVRAKEATAGGKLETDGEALGEALFEHTFGEGRAFLLNASFSSYTTHRVETGDIWRSWPAVIRAAATAAGLTPGFSYTVQNGEPRGLELSPFANGDGYLLGVADLGFGAYENERKAFTVSLPGRFHVYEMRSGRKVGEEAADSFTDTIPARGHRAYCLLPYEVERTVIGAGVADRANGQRDIVVDMNLRTKGERSCLHVVRLEARTPDGTPFYPFRRVLRLPPGRGVSVLLALGESDPRGTWTFTATDIGTGLLASADVPVGGYAQ